MSRAYSTRFLAAGGSTGDHFYTVPSGARAVLRVVDAINNGAAAAKLYVTIAGFAVSNPTLQASGSYHADTRQVAYAGEKIGLWLETVGLYGIVSGYLFEDLALTAAAASTMELGEPLEMVLGGDPVVTPWTQPSSASS